MIYVAYTRVPVVDGPVCFPSYFNSIIVVSQILHVPRLSVEFEVVPAEV